MIYHPSMTREDPQMKLRMPADLKSRIEAAANTASRSMNAEIIARLQSSFDDQTANASARINELELALARQRIDTITERNKSHQYSIALIEIAEHLPPGAFANRPQVEAFLKDARDNQHAKMIQALDQMMEDAQTVVSDLHANIDAGRIKVVSEQEKADRKRSKQIEVVVRGKKQVIEIEREEPEEEGKPESQPQNKTILVGNIGNAPDAQYIVEQKTANKGPTKRVRNKPPK